MNTYLKSGFAAAVVGLGIFASAGSAFAAGCLSPDQTQYALSDHTKAATDRTREADVRGFSCNTGDQAVATQLSTSMTTQHRAVASVAPPSESTHYVQNGDY
jgi:hypothetical protein